MASSLVKFNSGGKIVPRSDLRVGTTREEIIAKKHHILRVGAWNVRSLNRSGRLENLKREMGRLKLDVVGISEVRWQDEQDFWSGDYRIINTKSNRGNAGVGLVMNKKIGHRVSYYEQHSERLIVAKIDTKPQPTTIVQVYMPTSAADDEEIEKMYEEIEDILQYVKGEENLIVMGDWNAVVGKGKEDKTVGEHGLGERNERGSRLVEFCTDHNLVLANTWFEHHPRRLYTWMRPGDTGRYQIDYIMVKQRFRNQILDCKTFPGADVDSDHNLLVMKCRLKLKKLKRGKRTKRWDLEKLKEKEVRESFEECVTQGLSEKGERNTVEEEWTLIKEDIVKAADEKIGRKTRSANNPWVTQEILDLIDERRKYKNAHDEEGKRQYRRLKNKVDKKCKAAKENWLGEKCKAIENCMTRGKVDTAYRKIKALLGEKKKSCMNIKSTDGKPLLSKEEKAERWREHIKELYRGKDLSDQALEEEENVEEDDKGDPILRSEFDIALKDLGKNKASGIDDVPSELLCAMGETGSSVLFNLVRKIYGTGEVPSDFKKNVVITIPKKASADQCSDYRTISLISHACKILTRIIYRRMEHQVESELGEDQFGFRRNTGTREAILTLRLILEDRIRKNRPTFMAFVDLEKAFDNVDWNKLFEILKMVGIKYRDRRVIYNLYRDQTAVVRVEGHEREASIQKGVRQGCSLSPLLFNLYIEQAINEVKEKFGDGVTVQGEVIKTLRFADDIVVLSESAEDLEDLLNGMNETLKAYNMKINKGKTKVMECSRKKSGKAGDIRLGNEMLKEVNEFTYLGSRITWDGRSKADIKCRLAQARIAFMKKRALLTSKINIDIRKSFLKAYVWSVALYGSETWTIGETERKRIEAFEMWCYRRMLKIRWVDRVTNEEVLNRIGEERSLWRNLTKRRDRMIGHYLRHPGLVNLVLEGSVWGKNGRGRPRSEYDRQIRVDVGCSSYVAMKRLAQDRVAWRAASNQSKD